MTAIDWESKPEPWRSIGREFAFQCQQIMEGYKPPPRPQLTELQMIGRRLSDIRRGQGLSQRALAKKAGYDQMTISRIERGLERVNAAFRRQDLADALGVAVEDIWS